MRETIVGSLSFLLIAGCGGKVSPDTASSDASLPETEIVAETSAPMAFVPKSISRGCALSADGRVACWTNSNAKAYLLPFDDVVSLGEYCVVRRDGSVWCDTDAEPGCAKPRDPMRIDMPPAEIATGRSDHGCARAKGGDVWCWDWEASCRATAVPEARGVVSLRSLNGVVRARMTDGRVMVLAVGGAVYEDKMLFGATEVSETCGWIGGAIHCHGVSPTVGCKDGCTLPGFEGAHGLAEGWEGPCAIRDGQLFCIRPRSWSDAGSDTLELRAPDAIPGFSRIVDLADSPCVLEEGGRVTCHAGTAASQTIVFP